MSENEDETKGDGRGGEEQEEGQTLGKKFV